MGAPLDTLCVLCGHATAVERDPEPDEDRRVCSWCAKTWHLGRRLPQARWLTVSENDQGADLSLFGLGVRVSDREREPVGADTIALANLKEPEARTISSWSAHGTS